MRVPDKWKFLFWCLRFSCSKRARAHQRRYRPLSNYVEGTPKRVSVSVCVSCCSTYVQRENLVACVFSSSSLGPDLEDAWITFEFPVLNLDFFTPQRSRNVCVHTGLVSRSLYLHMTWSETQRRLTSRASRTTRPSASSSGRHPQYFGFRKL